jgi:hypothetical protein
MDDLKDRQQQAEAHALAVNAGRAPKFGDIMRNPWAGEGNPQRDGYFVRAKRTTGKLNPGLWYEMTDKNGKFWEVNGKCQFFIDAPSSATTAGERQSIGADTEFADLMLEVREAKGVEQQMAAHVAVVEYLDKILGARSAGDAAPAAWSYECLQPGGNGIWCEFFSREKPSADTHIRNISPLYGAAPAPGNTAQPSGKEE